MQPPILKFSCLSYKRPWYMIPPPPLSLHLPPAPPGQVDNATVRSENLSLRRTRLTWDAPDNNNARSITYWITYCIPLMDSSFNDTCRDQTTISVMENSMMELTDINPQRRYRITIQAGNAAGRGPESLPYFFDSASAGRCCYICRLYVRSHEPSGIWQTAAISFYGDLDEWKDLSTMYVLNETK